MTLFLFECPICKKIYKCRNSLKYHLKKHNTKLTISDCRRISVKTGEYAELKTT